MLYPLCLVSKQSTRTGFDMTYFVANLGGMLGLCLGASLLTMAEFIEYAVIAIAAFFNKRSIRSTTPVTEYKTHLDADPKH